MKNLDHLFLRDYKPGSYTCWDFVVEVWAELGQPDIATPVDTPTSLLGQYRLYKKLEKQLVRLPSPVAPCVVIMGNPPHAGVFLGSDIIHLEDVGVSCIPYDAIKHIYREMTFYGPDAYHN